MDYIQKGLDYLSNKTNHINVKEKISGFTKDGKILGKKMLYLLPTVIVGLVIMATISSFFGKNAATLGILFLFFQLMQMGVPFQISRYLKSAAILLVVGGLACFASMNAIASIFLNFLVPFALITLFSDDFSPRGYFIYGLFFLLMQTIPIHTIQEIPNILFAMGYGIAILLVYNIILSLFTKEETDKKLLKTGFGIVIKRLEALSKQQIEPDQKSPLFEITNKLTAMLYSNMTQKVGVLSNQEVSDFQGVLFLDRIDLMIKRASKMYAELQPKDFTYMEALSQLLQHVMENYQVKNKEILMADITTFMQEHHMEHSGLEEDVIQALKKLQHTLSHLTKKTTYRTTLKDIVRIRYLNIKNNLSLDTCQMRFAIRVALVEGIGFFIAHLIPFSRAYWLPMTSYSIMLPFHEETKEKRRTNIAGIIIGAIAFMLIFQFISTSGIGSFAFMAIAFLLLFSLSNDILRTVIGSQLALVMTYPMYTKTETLLMRIALVFGSVAICWLADRFVYHTDNFNGLMNKISLLLRTDKLILVELKKSVQGDKNTRYLNELLLESYLIEDGIALHEKVQNQYDGTYMKDTLLEFNKNFIIEAEQLINILKRSETEQEEKDALVRLLDGMNQMLTVTENIFEKGIVKTGEEHHREDLSVEIDREKLKETIAAIEENQLSKHTKKHMLRCVSHIGKIYHTINDSVAYQNKVS